MHRNIKLLLKVGTALASVVVVNSSQAFCIYNKTNAPFTVGVARDGSALGSDTMKALWNDAANLFIHSNNAFKGSFFARIEPGKDACCNYLNRGCNVTGRPISMLPVVPATVSFQGKTLQCLGYKDTSLADALSGSNMVTAVIPANGYATLQHAASYKPDQPPQQGNHPFILHSWTHDNKWLGEVYCHAQGAYSGK